MGTSGCVGVGTPKAWRGVYCHYDSYPSGLGRKIWHAAEKEGGFESLAKEILRYDCWKSYAQGGVCPLCGEFRGNPVTTTGPVLGWGLPEEIKKIIPQTTDPRAVAEDQEMTVNVALTGVPDPLGTWHTHHNMTAEEAQTDQDGLSPWSTDWLYIIDLDEQVLRIYRSAADTSTDNRSVWRLEEKGMVPFGGDEPDWTQFEPQD